MKCLLINLDRSHERLSHCENEFGKISVSFERVAAVDAFDLNSDFIKGIRLHNDWPKQTKTEFSCFLSHRKCWEIIANGIDPYGAIFEDDVVLSAESLKYLDGSKWIPSSVDLLRLETTKERVFFGRRGMKAFNRHVLKMESFQAGSAGYIVSKSLAKNLLQMTENYLPAPVDHFLFNPRLDVMKQYSTYQLVPAICIQDIVYNSGSTVHHTLIGNNRSTDQLIEKKKKLNSVQKIKREINRMKSKIVRFTTQKPMIVQFE